MVWRRSIVKLLLILTVVTAVDKCWDGYNETVKALADYRADPLDANITTWFKNQEQKGEPTGFSQYTLDVMNEIRRLRTSQVFLAQAAGRCILGFFEVIKLVIIMRAGYFWINFRRSRKLIIIASFFSLSAPYCISLMPARLFISEGSDRQVIKEYNIALQTLLGVQEKTNKIEDMCAFVHDEGNTHIQKAQDSVLQLCGWVDMLPRGKVKMPTTWKIWKWQEVDFTPGHKGCAQARELIRDAKPMEALEKTQQLCDTIVPEIRKYQDDNGNMPQVVDWISDKVTSLVQVSISTAFATRNFLMLFPVGLSIAPGLLQGALRMKVLMPQSAIPGMFVFMLPLLHCPLAWCLYSLIFQMVGYEDLFVGLVIISFGPLIYVIVAKVYNLTMPMTDEAVVRVVGKARWWVMVVNMIGAVSMIIFLFRLVKAYRDSHFDANCPWIEFMKGACAEKEDFGSSIENKALFSMLDVQNRDKWWFFRLLASNMLHAGTHALQAYVLTSTAGVDWMIGELVEFRLVELAMQLAEKHRDTHAVVGCNQYTHEILALSHEQRERINALVAVHEGVNKKKDFFRPLGQEALSTSEVQDIVSTLAIVDGAVVKLDHAGVADDA